MDQREEVMGEALRLMVAAAERSLATAGAEVDRSVVEGAVVAALEAIRTPTTGLLLSGADVPDSVGRFWPIMVGEIIQAGK